jgi:hypothetical protein
MTKRRLGETVRQDEKYDPLSDIFSVMAGLVPAIHVFLLH